MDKIAVIPFPDKRRYGSWVVTRIFGAAFIGVEMVLYK
jgi:hypothetical protein